MAEKISITKGLTSPPSFDTYVPELSDNADIQNAFELFYYGNSEDGNTIDGTNSIYSNLVSFDNRITSSTSGLSGHIGAISDVHGVGSGSEVVGTIKAQTLTNKTLTSPTINSPTITSPSISSPTVTGTAVLPSTTSIGNVSSTEISYVDGVTSSIQTQIDTNTPVGMISIHAGSSAPTGWLLCDGTSYASASYTQLFNVIGYTFGGSGSDFAVPNLKGRVVVGIDAAQVEFDTRGEAAGAKTHQHAASNSGNTSVAHNHTIPALSGSAVGAGAHNHSVNAHSHNISTNGDHDHGFTGSVSTSTNGVSQSRTTGNTISTNIPNHSHGDNFNPTTIGDHTHNTNNPGTSTSSDGGNHGHNVGTTASATTDGAGGSHTHTTPASDTLSNLQPYMALNYIIKI